MLHLPCYTFLVAPSLLHLHCCTFIVAPSLFIVYIHRLLESFIVYVRVVIFCKQNTFFCVLQLQLPGFREDCLRAQKEHEAGSGGKKAD
jgi:hypothetical protein